MDKNIPSFELRNSLIIFQKILSIFYAYITVERNDHIQTHTRLWYIHTHTKLWYVHTHRQHRAYIRTHGSFLANDMSIWIPDVSPLSWFTPELLTPLYNFFSPLRMIHPSHGFTQDVSSPDVSTSGKFTPRKVHPPECSPAGRFIPGMFTPRTVHPPKCSPPRNIFHFQGALKLCTKQIK